MGGFGGVRVRTLVLAGVVAGVLVAGIVSPVEAVAGPTPSLTPTATPTPTPTTTAPPTGSLAQLLVPSRVTAAGPVPKLPWPKQGRARVLVAGLGSLGRSGTTAKSVPVASVTKVMTAYQILRDRPLAPGEQGPKITVLKSEAKAYPKRRAAGESVVKIKAGEKLTERQALEALLIPSGNNIADLLARWDRGSGTAFVARMNTAATSLGMTATHFADPSGLSSASRSSASDLLKLAPAAMADPTFAAIVAEPSARIPYVTVRTTNRILGTHGVIGIKTGSTRAAGGCLLFAARKTVAGQVLTTYGVVLGAPGPLILTNALKEADKLVVAAGKALRPVTLLTAGTPVASLTGPDGTTARYALAQDLDVPGWPGLQYGLAFSPALQPGEAPTALYVTGPGSSRTGGVQAPLVPLPSP